jgi:large subunit ribosomal protein L37Ae
MPRKSKQSLTGLGVKYGATVRKRYTRIHRELKSRRSCPSCGSSDFARKAVGLWKCGKCGYTATGGAFSFG